MVRQSDKHNKKHLNFKLVSFDCFRCRPRGPSKGAHPLSVLAQIYLPTFHADCGVIFVWKKSAKKKRRTFSCRHHHLWLAPRGRFFCRKPPPRDGPFKWLVPGLTLSIIVACDDAAAYAAMATTTTTTTTIITQREIPWGNEGHSDGAGNILPREQLRYDDRRRPCQSKGKKKQSHANARQDKWQRGQEGGQAMETRGKKCAKYARHYAEICAEHSFFLSANVRMLWEKENRQKRERDKRTITPANERVCSNGCV